MAKWMTIGELPKGEEMHKKVVILAEGRFQNGRLHVTTGYWHVYCVGNELVGRLECADVPLESIKAVAFESDFLDEYNDTVKETTEIMKQDVTKDGCKNCACKTNDEKKVSSPKTGFTGWSYTYRDNGKDEPTREFIKLSSKDDGKV